MPATSPEAIARKRAHDAPKRRERARTLRATNRRYQDNEQRRHAKQSAQKWSLGNMWLNCVDGEANNAAQYEQFGVFDGTRFFDIERPGEAIVLHDVVRFLAQISQRERREDKTRRSNVFLMFAKHYDEDKWIGADPLLTDEQKLAIASQRSAKYGAVRGPGWERDIILPELGIAVYFGRKETTLTYLKMDWKRKEPLRNEDGAPLSYMSIKIWDTWSLTAQSFVKTLKPLFKVMSDDEKAHFTPLYELVQEGKAERGAWTETFDFAKRKQYNHAELELMHYWLNHIIQACKRVGLAPKSLAGPAPFARALLHKYGLTHHVQPADYKTVEYQQSSEMHWQKRAYYGARIECRIQGVVDCWYELDLSSAYPAVMRDLPCMAHGHWRTITRTETQGALLPTAIYQITYQAKRNALWGPLPSRDKKGSVSYPIEGTGCYFGCEILAAAPFMSYFVHLGMVWESECDDPHPFAKMIDEMFALRKSLLAEGDDGAALVIKLALNSLYGILAQCAGAAKIVDEQGIITEYKLPKFYNLFGAGYITGATRARLYSVIGQFPDAVIGAATDALHLLFIPQELRDILTITDADHKELGTWTEEIHGETFFISPGIRSSADGTHSKSRGFSVPPAFTTILETIARGETNIDIVRNEYQDIRASRMGPTQGTFQFHHRLLDISPSALSSKRDITRGKPVGRYISYPAFRTAGINYGYSRRFDNTTVAEMADARAQALDWELDRE